MTHRPIRLLKAASLNSAGTAACSARIHAGDVDKTSDWSFDAEDGNKLLGDSGEDWGEYAKWFMAVNSDQPEKTKGHYSYPFGKNGKVYRSALIAIRSRAAQNNEDAVFDAAGRYIDEIDGKKNYTGAKALAMVQRAWSQLTLNEKGLTETDTHYMLSGIATTPSPDRMADIVEPLGAEYDLPIPLLWQHDSSLPIGQVTEAAPSKSGIPVSFQIPKVLEAGTLKDRLDEAVQSIKYGLVKGLSIGFAPIEYSYMEDTGGYRFLKWSWLELSAVTIPANAEASIANIKSYGMKTIAKRKRIALEDPTVFEELKISPHLPKDTVEAMHKNLQDGAKSNVKRHLSDNASLIDEEVKRREKL